MIFRNVDITVVMIFRHVDITVVMNFCNVDMPYLGSGPSQVHDYSPFALMRIIAKQCLSGHTLL